MEPSKPEAVVVTLPQAVTPPWALAFFIFLAAASFYGVAVVLGMSSVAGYLPPAWVAVALGACGAACSAAAFVQTAGVRGVMRLRRRARMLLMQHEAALFRASEGALVAAVLAVEGCREGQPIRLSRTRLDHWTTRLKSRLPQVWIANDGAARRLELFVGGAAEPPQFPEPGHAALYPATRVGRATESAAVLRALVGAVVSAAAGWLVVAVAGWGQTWWGVFVPFLVGPAVGAALYSIGRGVRGRAGWWLAVSPDRARLVQLRRRGEEVAGFDLDLPGTVVVVTDASLRRNPDGSRAEHRLAWRIVPPLPAPTVDVFDMDPRIGPWADAVEQGIRTRPV